MKYDMKITNAQVIDGTGRKAFSGELAIKNGYIEKVDARVTGDAKREIDAGGKVLSPGFIDLHNHAFPGLVPKTHMHHVSQGIVMNFLQQGVTTIVTGNCGFAGRISQITDNLDKIVMGPNFAMLAGHNSIRTWAMNRDKRPPSASELAKMKKLLKEELDGGAFGLSTGLAYVPGAYAGTEEVIELTKVLQGTKGFYASHMRNEGDRVADAVKEVLDIGNATGIPVHISHHKVCGVKNRGRSRETISLIKEARQKGTDITLDQYPYTASCGTIQLLLPVYVGEGSPDDIKNRIKNNRKKIREEVLDKLENFYGGELSRIVFATCAQNPSLAGKTLADASKTFGRKDSLPEAAETVLDMVSADASHGSSMCISHSMSEEDVEYILRYGDTSVGSDGWEIAMSQGHPHPRSYGTFPRVLGRYARDKKIITVEEAVKKMTSMPAGRLNLKDRGIIKEGARADIAVWDRDTIKDTSTFETPHRYPEGIECVIVNGMLTLYQGKSVQAYSGVFLKKEDR